MSEPRESADDLDIKQCGRCAAWIPRTATMCAYCNTSSPDSRIDPRPKRTPVGLPPWVTVTRVLVAVNILYFVFSVCAQMSRHPETRLPALLIEGRGFNWGLAAAGAYMPERVAGGEWWRVISYAFLHGGLLHIGLNMWAFHRLGHLAEELFGAAKLLVVYFACTLATVGFEWFVTIRVLGRAPAEAGSGVGASGAIFGVGGLLAAFLIRRGSPAGRQFGKTIAMNLSLMIVLNLMFFRGSTAGHIGGLIPGVLAGLLVRERFSTLLSPESRRNWWLVATLAAVTTMVALGMAVSFTLHAVGAPR